MNENKTVFYGHAIDLNEVASISPVYKQYTDSIIYDRCYFIEIVFKSKNTVKVSVVPEYSSYQYENNEEYKKKIEAEIEKAFEEHKNLQDKFLEI